MKERSCLPTGVPKHQAHQLTNSHSLIIMWLLQAPQVPNPSNQLTYSRDIWVSRRVRSLLLRLDGANYPPLLGFLDCVKKCNAPLCSVRHLSDDRVQHIVFKYPFTTKFLPLPITELNYTFSHYSDWAQGAWITKETIVHKQYVSKIRAFVVTYLWLFELSQLHISQ